MTEKAPRMTDLESQAWLGLINLVHLLPHTLDTQLQRDSSMTHFEFSVLSSLFVSPDATAQMTELAANTASTLPRLSHVCSKLEKRGLVDRYSCPSDRRATNVHLTTAGRRAFIHALPEHIALARRLVIEALSEDELEALANISGKIGERITDYRAR